LQRVEDVGDLDPEHLDLVAIDLEIDLRSIGSVRAEHAGEFGLTVGRNDQGAQCTGNIAWRLALQRLQRKLKSAGAAEPENGR